jgi:ribosomal protein S18 acetylase RimI-like enzyme
MDYINFRLLRSSDAASISNLLLSSSLDYLKYFHPFDFHEASISSKLDAAIIDKYFGIQLESNSLNGPELVGFYMLRGMDEGYLEPMYGVFISQHWHNKGIARLSLCHGECFCKMNSYKRLLLKVHPNNYRARNLYESFGFMIVRDVVNTSNILMLKDL